MTEVIAIIRSDCLQRTRSRLQGLSLEEGMQYRVLGRGRQRGMRYLSREGASEGTGVQFFPKRLLSWIVADSQVESLIDAIIEANRTGGLGDGKIFVLPVEQSFPISSEEGEVEQSAVQEWLAVAETTHASR